MTDSQRRELEKRFKVEKIINLPENLREILRDVPGDLFSSDKIVEIERFITSNLSKGDYIWVQTEYGLTCYLVSLSFKMGYIPIYSFTKRVYNEKKLEGEKIKREHIFKHIEFKIYRRCEK